MMRKQRPRKYNLAEKRGHFQDSTATGKLRVRDIILPCTLAGHKNVRRVSPTYVTALGRCSNSGWSHWNASRKLKSYHQYVIFKSYKSMPISSHTFGRSTGPTVFLSVDGERVVRTSYILYSSMHQDADQRLKFANRNWHFYSSMPNPKNLTRFPNFTYENNR